MLDQVKNGPHGSFVPIHDTDAHVDEGLQHVGIDELVQQIKETADKLLRDHASRGDVKLLSTALRELRYCFKVFASMRGRRKVTAFGSARLPLDHPSCVQAIEFGRRMGEQAFLAIPGAAQG